MIVNALVFVAGIAIFWISCLVTEWTVNVFDRTRSWLQPGVFLLGFTSIILTGGGIVLMFAAVIEPFVR